MQIKIGKEIKNNTQVTEMSKIFEKHLGFFDSTNRMYICKTINCFLLEI
jgi:hypothetical protein